MSASWDDIDKAWQTAEPAKAGGAAYDPIPEGTKVNLVITSQKPAYVGQNQTPCVKVVFECVDEAYADRKVWHDFWVTEANVKYLKRDLGILGWKGQKLSDLMREKDTSLMCLGANATVGVESYEKVLDSGEAVTRQKNTIQFFNETFTYVPKAEGKAAPAAAAAPKPPSLGLAEPPSPPQKKFAF